MKDNIPVYLGEMLLGNLSADDYGTLIFQYSKSHLSNRLAQPISCSMPLREEAYYGHQAHAFFIGLLPEESELTQIAKTIGTDPDNSFRLLKELGKETIGGLSIGQITNTKPGSYELLSDQQLKVLINHKNHVASELYTKNNVRLSIAGAQSKFSVLHKNGKFYLAKNGGTSNTIIKPPSERFDNLIENELITMTLAKRSGIYTANCFLIKIDEVKAYAVERFDRVLNGQHWERVIQEDFCQAIGVMPHNKYEMDGGLGFVKCIKLIKEKCTTPAKNIPIFIDQFIFNFIVGNKDAHGKNFSLIIQNGHRKMAPAYDLVATAMYPTLSQNMAMSINGKYDDELVTLEDWKVMAKQSELSPRLLEKRIIKVLKGIQDNLPKLVDLDISESYKKKYLDYIGNRLNAVFADYTETTQV